MSMNELPTRADYANAILGYWKGGGTTQLIIDVCREQMATAAEAEALGSRLADRVETGLKFVTRDTVSETLEYVRASGISTRRKSRDNDPGLVGSPAWIEAATQQAKANWSALFPDEPFPSSPSIADERYHRLIRETYRWERPRGQ